MPLPDRATASPQGTRSLLAHPADFPHRHIGPGESEIAEMLEALGVSSLDELVDETVPGGIRLGEELDLPAPLSEPQALAELREKAAENQIFRSFIGRGDHDCITPTSRLVPPPFVSIFFDFVRGDIFVSELTAHERTGLIRR